MSRKSVTVEELYAVLQREFSMRRSEECRACVTPIPVRRTPADEASTNWFITEPIACAHNCNALLGEIATELMSRYELERSVPIGRRR